jgi:enterochelin esterase-like enzyme
VLPADIYVSGGSRGGEAALLLGVHYPSLVHGVIASSPSDISFGAGHLAGALVPYEPQSASAINAQGQGDTLLANASAVANLWTRLPRFLAEPATQSGTITIPAAPTG